MLALPTYIGDYRYGSKVSFFFNTYNRGTGVPATLVGGAPLTLSRNGVDPTLISARPVLTTDFLGVVGRHVFTVDMSDGEDLAVWGVSPAGVGAWFSVRLAAGATVGGVSVGNRVVCNWTVQVNGPLLDNRSRVTLAPSGLDPVQVDGQNARQVLALAAAAIGGEVSGAGTGAITEAAAGNPSTPRIAASVDNYGNRSSITLTPPA